MPNYHLQDLIPQENPQELERLVLAYLDIWNHPDHIRFLSYTQIPFEEMQVREWFSSHLETGVFYTAELDDGESIIGIAITRENPAVGYELAGLGVRTVYKRQGVGKSLVGYILERVEKLGHRAVDVSVFSDNAPMLRLLLGMDFIPVRMQHHRRWDGGDVLHLKKYIKSGDQQGREG